MVLSGSLIKTSHVVTKQASPFRILVRSLSQKDDIKTPKELYKYLIKETKKLPEEPAKFYKDAIKRGYSQHVDETDPERIQQIIKRSIEDAEWIVNKYTGDPKKSS